MTKNKKYLVGVYTSVAKAYCDQEFFDALNKLPEDQCDIAIVDNSNDVNYLDRIKRLCPRAEAIRTKLKTNPAETLFLRKVSKSANLIRSYFLHHDYMGLIIIESDVIVPDNLLDLFSESQEKANNWSIIGGLYYKGLHKELETDSCELEQVTGINSVFSGCTLYNRELISKTKFRYSQGDLRVFPDSWMSYDAKDKGYSIYHYNKIKCIHREKEGSYIRGRELINE